jgi:sRNA-binding carbon storage regulator CsrA
VVTTPLGTSLFGIQIHEGATFFEIFAPEDVEMNSREVYGSVSEKNRKEKNGVEKNTGGGNHPPW